MPLIDVIIPVKNGLPYLTNTLESLRAQSFDNWRAFLLDHASTDRSMDILTEFSAMDSRFVVFDVSFCKSVSDVRNFGLDLASSEIVVFSDADDISHPQRFGSLYQAHCLNPDVAVIGSNALVINAAGNQTGFMKLPLTSEELSCLLFFRTPIFQPASSLKLKMINEIGARYGKVFIKSLSLRQTSEFPCVAEDYLFFGQIGLCYPLLNLKSSLISYRWHSTNISNNKRVEQLQNARDVSDMLAMQFSEMHSVPSFSPSLFSDHGNRLTNVSNNTDLNKDFENLTFAFHQVFGDVNYIKNELAFRECLITRNRFTMLFKFIIFLLAMRPITNHFKTILSYLLRRTS